MPPVLVFVATYATAITVTVTVGTALYTGYQAKKQAKKMEESMRRMEEQQAAADKALATQQSEFYGGGGGGALREDTKLMLKSSKQPRNVIFGRDRVSGPMMPFFSYEQNGVLYHRFGVVLAGHECDAVEQIYLDDEPVTLDVAGWVIAPAKYTDNGRSLFFIEKKLGGPAQTASQYLIDAAAYAGTPTAWGTDRKAIGVCYVVVHMEANYDVLHDIGLPNVSAIVRGVKAYDPRTMTTAWTRNPALLARWWLVDSVYSPLTLDSDIDQAELIASANVCDEQVAFSATVTANRYACDGALSSTANPLENLNKIMAAMDGDAVWVSGKWQLIAGYYKAPALSINESHLSGGQITVSPYTPTAQIVNTISGQYKGPETKYQASGYPAIAPPTYLAEDGGEVYERKDDFDLVNDAARCQMIAWQRLSRARQQLAINMVCNLKAYNSSPLQTVSVSLAEFGYANKTFQVRKRIFNGYSVEYFLQETSAAVWNWNYALADQVVDTPNVNINVDLAVEALQNVVVDSGTVNLVIDTDGTVRSRIRVRWDAVTSFFVINGGKIEWQYRTSDVGSGAGPWLNAAPCAGNATTLYIQPVEDGVSYNLRGRAVSQLGRRGTPTALLTHVVIGKTEPPPDVVQFTISGNTCTWQPVDIPDLAGYELRFHYGNNLDWGIAQPLHIGVITESPYDLVSRPVGPITVLVKAIDTLGNYSLNAAYVVTDLGDPLIANLVETIVFDPAFAGTLTTCGLVGGDLLANEDSMHYGNDAAQHYGVDSADHYPPSTYSAMEYITEPFYINQALSGSVATLLMDAAGNGMRVWYRLVEPGEHYGADDALHYGADGINHYAANSEWLPWPGQAVVNRDIYQFKVNIEAGSVQGRINTMKLVIDAPDLIETLDDLLVPVGGLVVPYTSPFASISNVQATLQANASGATRIDVNKTNPLAPKITAYNGNTAVAGAFVDVTLKGY